MLMTAEPLPEARKNRTSYALSGAVRESDIFWWPDQPLFLDLSKATRLVAGASEKILEAASRVVVEIRVTMDSTGWEVIRSSSIQAHLRPTELADVFEVLP